MRRTSLAATPATARARDLLLDFLSDHDVACPVCGYNLRGLAEPVCPECRQDLVLTVGAPRVRLAWLFIALAPGFFSGIAAFFMALFTTAIYFEDGYVVPPFVGAVLFGWGSGVFAVVLAVRRNRFIARPRARQRLFALVIWLVHVAALVVLGIFTDPYIS